MGTKTIRIRLDEENYFEHVITILRAVPPFDKLRAKELEAYSRLLYHYNKLQNNGKTFAEINQQLFSYDMRKIIEKEIKVGDSGYRNLLSRLRAVGIISNKSLKKQFIIAYSEDIEFKFFNN